jgi:hypothetical protein
LQSKEQAETSGGVERKGLTLNKELMPFAAKIAGWLNIEWHKFVASFERKDLPIKSFYEYKRTAKRWTQLLDLMEVETVETFGLNSYRTNETEEECVVALNVDFRFMFDQPNVCYLHLMPDILDPHCIDQTGRWLLPLVECATEILEPLYGAVHIGDQGLNWYLYVSGAEDSSFPVEWSEDIDVFASADILRTKVPRVYWGNLLSVEHIRQLGNVDELRAWELGSLEWRVYSNAVLTEEFRRLKSIPPARPGVRVDWSVQVHQIGKDYVFFTLTPNPLDWSPNIGISGPIKAEYRRITKLFRSRNLIA